MVITCRLPIRLGSVREWRWKRALARAGIGVAQVDYINLHGTATIQNDAMEARVVHALFGDRVSVSSTKPFTGHALGAAGAIEAGLCWLAMQDDNPTGKLPPHLWDGVGRPRLAGVERGRARRESRPFVALCSEQFIRLWRCQRDASIAQGMT